MGILDKIFGNANQREIEKIKKIVEQINSLEKDFEKFSDEEIKEKTAEFKKRLKNKETLNEILPEAFATAREAAKRTIHQRAFDSQLMGGVILHQGTIAEMKTGEGKTLASIFPGYLNALTGKGLHIVSVNDYLSARDANWMGSIYYFLGISTACILHDSSFLYEPNIIDENEVSVEEENLKAISRKEAYNADITYGTNNEFGFDYLRDNMAPSLEQISQRDLNFAIVDEVDSILIDEARTPLIISAPDTESTKMYEQFARLVPRLKENDDYNVDEKMRSVTLTQEGITKMEKWLGIGNIYETSKISYVHHLEQALRAQIIFQLDRDYVIKEGEIVIVDDFTGRLTPGRRYSEGLHQAIEAKEGVKVQRESRTLASITFQNYFRMYDKLAGMTGTAVTSAEEFFKVYELDVIEIPTNRPLIRKDLSDMIYKTEKGKFNAIAEKIKELNKKGQPVLVGTIAIEKSELLSEALGKSGIDHEVLNAKNHGREAQIIAKAGQKKAVTIATNMAGRGTDIKLGEGVKKVGGLFILGTERHEARRIDNQLRGRAGRQGDPGMSQFFVSLEDELLRRFGGDRLKGLMNKLGLPDNQPIENKMISRSIESAQSKIEGFNFDIRKHVLEYDDVINKQREVIYKKRKDVLKKESVKNEIDEMISDEAESIVGNHTAMEEEDRWNTEEISEEVYSIFSDKNNAELHKKLIEIKGSKSLNSAEKKSKMVDLILDIFKSNYGKIEKEFSSELMRGVEKNIYLRTIDSFWMDHLDNIDYLRDSIGLQGYGQRDPLIEYKKEAFNLFQNLLGNINHMTLTTLFRVRPAVNHTENLAVKEKDNQDLQYSGGETPNQFSANVSEQKTNSQSSEAPKPVVNKDQVGRNEPCPCGSGKKYKKCCGKVQ
ncbi:MAG: preprotein translocase subunit SecA [Patescibacteria group bacterium]|jgi:preprotein translocase subunit SecA|nr:preprotein translocase subunit SecA [Patescibacteria group bacterium]